MRPPFDLSLYLVTDRPLSRGRDIGWIVEEAVRGGVTMVQLREKECHIDEFVQLARRLVALLRPLGVPLIINDNIDVALQSDADGVHIGQSDMDYATVRHILGDDKIIGLSVETLDQVTKANALDVDYIGVSPVYATRTKTDTFIPFGMDRLREAIALTEHPSVAIGGMNCDTVGGAMHRGVDGVAVVSAIVSADSPQEAAKKLRAIVESGKPKWSNLAWSVAEPLYDKILHHPFNQGLMNGNLPKEAFASYLQQDRIYIDNYSKEMFALANMLPDHEMKHLFRQFAYEGMEAEKILHQMLSEMLCVGDDGQASTVTVEYMAHTGQYVNDRRIELASAAILPCLWIYNELGKYLINSCIDKNNPYMKWIDTYSSPLMNRGIEQTIALCDRLASLADTKTRVLMRRAFVRTVELEYDFFDYPFRIKKHE